MAGHTNREIADRLYSAESTVKTHLSSAFRKLDARSRSEAVSRIMDPESGYRATILLANDGPIATGYLSACWAERCALPLSLAVGSLLARPAVLRPGRRGRLHPYGGSQPSPEELLVVVLAQRHIRWYRHLAADAGVVVTDSADEPLGTMAEQPDGSGQFTEVLLEAGWTSSSTTPGCCPQGRPRTSPMLSRTSSRAIFASRSTKSSCAPASRPGDPANGVILGAGGDKLAAI